MERKTILNIIGGVLSIASLGIEIAKGVIGDKQLNIEIKDEAHNAVAELIKKEGLD